MNFFRFWPKRSAKASFNKDLLGVDLFCQLTYMSAIATSGLTRSQIFEYASRLPFTSSKYFRDVHFLAQKLNYDYAQACRIVGEATKEAEPKALLLRLSGCVASGEPEADFLAREAHVVGEVYGNQYERSVESLRKWTDAYVALTLSAALVIIVCVVSMMIYPVQPTFVVTLSGLMLLVTVLGAWIMYRASPKEIKTHSLPETSREQKLSRTLFIICLPLAVVVCSLLALKGMEMGRIMLIGAAFLLPTGLVIMWDDRNIDKRDNDIAGLLRSLGGVATAIGSTLTEALSRLDLHSVASLQAGARRLRDRLRSGIKPDLCWQRFVAETGSELVNRSVQTFWDGVSLGGDPQRVGNQSSLFAMKVALLRAHRRMVSSTFSWLCITMHAAIAGLLTFIYHIMLTFSRGLQSMTSAFEEPGTLERMPDLPSFTFLLGGNQLQLLHSVVVAVIVVLTATNAVAIKVTGGGHKYKYLFYLSITLAISGACFLFVPEVVSTIFGALPPME
ncbi:MAG: hypothetical protein DRI39_09575 [Chloroflexi bacterium]|nr:MAG: hypothetical protein DRI39_09575 [Chloroflexota bacterium]